MCLVAKPFNLVNLMMINKVEKTIKIHSKSAINLNSRQQALERIYNDYKQNSEQIKIVFYCTYSQNGALQGYWAFRDMDRRANIYPNISYPNMFVLEGGYHKFYQEHQLFCDGGFDPNIKYRPINLIRSHKIIHEL